MTGPSGNARAAAIVPPDAKAVRSETNDCGSGGSPGSVAAQLFGAPAEGLLGAAQGKCDPGVRARRVGAPVYAALDLGTDGVRICANPCAIAALRRRSCNSQAGHQ